jgi:carbamoyltransferase
MVGDPGFLSSARPRDAWSQVGDRASDRCVVGIYFGHNASVALASGGRIIAVLQEERLRGLKNFTGFPAQAYRALVHSHLQDDPGRIELVVFPTVGNQEYSFYFHTPQFADGRYFGYYGEAPLVAAQIDAAPLHDRAASERYVAEDRARIDEINESADVREEALSLYERELGVGRDRFMFISHHQAHAYSTCFNVGVGRPALIFTLDSSGDNLCATVSLCRDGEVSQLSADERYSSMGRLYREVTAFLGMKPDEHEAKVMGLAAYARRDQFQRASRKLEGLIWLDSDLHFRSAFPMEFMKQFLVRECCYERFDVLAGAVQAFLEERVLEWIRAWIARTGVADIALAGGVFMNVKLNQRIADLPEVLRMFVVPSPGDESTVFGCCYFGLRQCGLTDQVEPVRALSLGLEYSADAIERAISEMPGRSGVAVRRVPDVEGCVAQLLAAGEIVGWFSGRCEFGARALGNRSILADPRRRETVELINRAIKGRDFWMPFAPSILAERWGHCVLDHAKEQGHHMMTTFPASDQGRRDFAAALHHGDYTMRAQKVEPSWLPRYHRLLSRFEDLTGVPGVLNTSLNLHGEPLALSPADALGVFVRSGLGFLALEDFLVSKGKEGET